MKNLILVMLFFVGSQAVYAQATQIKLGNNTGCTIYFTLQLTTAASPCGGPGTTSSVIALAPGNSIFYTNTSYPGFSNPLYVYFNVIRIYLTNPSLSCAYPALHLGQVCSSFPQTTAATWNDLSCGLCSSGSATWVYTASSSLVDVQFY